MSKNRMIRALALLWLCVLMLWGASSPLAQTQAQKPSPANTQKQKPNLPPPNTQWVKDPSRVMPMRSMTNAQRRAAAQRQQARRAAHKGNSVNPAPAVKP